MRFPWLQVDTDFITHRAADVAVLLGCSRAQAIGHLSLLWAWAVARSPEDVPPTGVVSGHHAVRLVEAAAEWTGEPGALLEVLCDPDVALLEKTPDGVRVRGLGRYAKAWDKQRKDRERKAELRALSGGIPADGAGKKKTQKKKETTPQPPTGGQGSLLVDGEQPAAPKTPPPEALRDVWNAVAGPQGFQRWEAMSEGRKKAARLALDAVPDVSRWEAWLRHELARPFNRGENDSGWKADADWLLRAKTRDLVRDFDPTAVPSRGDRPRLGPRIDTPAATFNPDKPRL